MTQGGPREWPRLFGLLLTDYFTGSPFVVELEPDLSLQQQLLDVVIVRKRRGRFTGRLPDGLDDLLDYNLITFKSHQGALDDWSLKELTGHYVKYRRKLTERGDPLLPEEVFRLYAVCARFPHNLAQLVPWEQLQEGVYQVQRGTDRFRVIVTGQLPQTDHNAPLHLFSAAPEQVRYGAQHYRQRSEDTSTLLNQLFQGYEREGLTMPYTMEDFRRDFRKQFIKELTPEERLEGLSPEETKQLLQKGLEGLSPEEIDQLVQKVKAAPSSSARKPRRKR
jgi:hypothetical protein